MKRRNAYQVTGTLQGGTSVPLVKEILLAAMKIQEDEITEAVGYGEEYGIAKGQQYDAHTLGKLTHLHLVLDRGYIHKPTVVADLSALFFDFYLCGDKER